MTLFLQCGIFGQSAPTGPEKRILQELGASVLDRCRHMWPVQSVWPVSLVSQDRGCSQPLRAIIALHLDQCPGHSMAVLRLPVPRRVLFRCARRVRVTARWRRRKWPVANRPTKRPYQACTSLMDAAIWAGPLERVRSSCLLELCHFPLLRDHCSTGRRQSIHTLFSSHIINSV